MHRINKGLIVHGLMDFIFIIVAMRHSDVTVIPRHQGLDLLDSSSHGPSLLTTVSVPSNGRSRKPFHPGYDPLADEYNRIMQDVRSQYPVPRLHASVSRSNVLDDGVITMVLGLSEPSGSLSHGGLQVLRNFPTDGAVGGFSQPLMADENLDIFNNFLPGNMEEEDIDGLLSSNNTASLEQTFSDLNWQQFISDYDSFVNGASGIAKSIDNMPAAWGTSDILSEAIQSSELFLPLPSGSQNYTDSQQSDLASEVADDPTTTARLEMIEFNGWAGQNHEEDMLFPSLPPPSYEQVTCTQANRTHGRTLPRVLNDNHLHDHNYYNSSRAPPVPQVAAQTTSYAIRSRHEVSTRVISVPPRSRHISTSTDSSVSSSVDEIVDCHESEAEIVRQQLDTFDSFVIKPLDVSYFDNISKTVGAQREIILCN